MPTESKRLNPNKKYALKDEHGEFVEGVHAVVRTTTKPERARRFNAVYLNDTLWDWQKLWTAVEESTIPEFDDQVPAEATKKKTPPPPAEKKSKPDEPQPAKQSAAEPVADKPKAKPEEKATPSELELKGAENEPEPEPEPVSKSARKFKPKPKAEKVHKSAFKKKGR